MATDSPPLFTLNGGARPGSTTAYVRRGDRRRARAPADTGRRIRDEDSAPTWLTLVALVVGALGLVAGIAGLTTARRRAT
jgi:hypothetical protein